MSRQILKRTVIYQPPDRLGQLPGEMIRMVELDVLGPPDTIDDEPTTMADITIYEGDDAVIEDAEEIARIRVRLEDLLLALTP